MRQSNVSGDWTSGHWTDDQLIADNYGVGPADDHLMVCAECQTRRAALINTRSACERLAPAGDEVSFDFLAAQRRGMYARLAQPARIGFRRLVSTAAALLVIGAGVFTYQEEHRPMPPPAVAQTHISDAQLVNEVAEMGQDSEPAPVAPIEELFD